jgi:cell division protease FtsH
VALLTVSILSYVFYGAGQLAQVLPCSEVKQMIRDGEMSKAILAEHAITIRPSSGLADSVEHYRAVTPAQADPELLPLLEEEDDIENP